MTKFQQPGQRDAVKGGQSSLFSGAVLGGLSGVKQRLSSPCDEVRIAALNEAFKYGRDGLELVVQIVKTETGAVQHAAYDLLYQRVNESTRIKLLKYSPGKAIYQNLLEHLSQILDDDFRKQLAIGKYSRWAVSLSVEQIPPMLCAITQYARPGLDAQERLNARQVAALSFVHSFRRLDYLDELDTKIAILGLSYSSPDFEENIHWADQLTRSDLFGVLWHVGGFSCRGYSGEDNLNSLHTRSQECLNCLMQVAQGKQTYYQLAGIQYPLREPR